MINAFKSPMTIHRHIYLYLLCLILPLIFTCGKVSSIAAIPGKLCADWLVSTADEVAMGNNFKIKIQADIVHYPPYIKNTIIPHYIDSIGQAIVDHQTDRPETDGLNYSFTVINDTAVNAFAIPGGHVFINTGLIKAAKNEAELAGVIAHEVAHITNRHGVQALCTSGMLDFLTQLVAGDSSIIGQVLENISMASFSKENEFQADTTAVKFLINSTYNPYGMKSFLQTLYTLYGDVPLIFEPASDHPPTSDRIDLVQQAIIRRSGVDNAALNYQSRFDAYKSSL